MWWNKKKKVPLVLLAPQARIIAQMQQSRLKFELEQHALQRILDQANQGAFQTTAYAGDVSGIFLYAWIINEATIDFLKSQGYKVEKEEKTWSDNRYSPNDKNHRLTKYNAYTIKW